MPSQRSTSATEETARGSSTAPLFWLCLVVAAALLAAADQVAKKPKVKKASKKAKRAAADTADAAGDNVIDVTDILVMAAREGARALKNR